VHIKKTIEHPDGSFEINGDFSADEIKVILEVGLNSLYQAGALPIMAINMKDVSKFMPFSKEEQ
jgi:hypothetical protein